MAGSHHGGAWDRFSPEPPEGPPADGLMSDVWLPELAENTFLPL